MSFPVRSWFYVDRLERLMPEGVQIDAHWIGRGKLEVKARGYGQRAAITIGRKGLERPEKALLAETAEFLLARLDQCFKPSPWG